MSIVHFLYLSAGHGAAWPAVAWLAPLLALSLAAGLLVGAVFPAEGSRRDRIPDGRPALPLVGVMFGAFGVWLFSTSLYATIEYPHASHPSTTQPYEPPPSEIAFVSTVPPLLGFLALLLGDQFAREACDQDLGTNLRRLIPGLIPGIIGVVIIVPPLMFLIAPLVELIYRHVHYHHPTEHPFLRTLGGKPSLGVTVAIVVGACVIAPLFEELLFRGHLQTLIRRGIGRLFANRVELVGNSVDPAMAGPSAPIFIDASRPSSIQTWAAIIITSAIFAAIHPLWSQPMIFILALGLGYSYERTNNLWVPVSIHAGFNTINTAIFLLSLYKG